MTGLGHRRRHPGTGPGGGTGSGTGGPGGEYLTCEPDSGGTWRWSDGVPG
ncbi:hypothetical protein ACIQ1J_10890 [Streptomyces sp. NPDC097107]